MGKYNMRGLQYALLSFLLLVVFFLMLPNWTNANESGKGKPEERKSHPKIVKELLEKRTAKGKSFLLDDGSYQSVISLQNQHYRDGNGQWQDINPELLRKGKYYEARNVSFEASLPNKYQDGYSIGKGEKRFSFLPMSASEEAEGKNIDKQTLYYSEVWPSTDAEIVLLAGGIKETLILKDKHAPKFFSFEIKGKIDKNLQAGDFEIPMAWLVDANGTYKDAKQELRQEGDKQYIDIQLNDVGLVYPIRLDPSIMELGAVEDATFIDPFNPNYVDGLYGGGSLLVGASFIPDGGLFNSFLKFDLSSFEGEIKDAQLMLYREGGNGSSPLTIESRMITNAWEENDFYDRPQFGELIGSTNTPAVNTGEPVIIQGMEKYVRHVLQGNPNYGIGLSGSGYWELAQIRMFYSREAKDPHFVPKLIINYLTKPEITEIVAPSENQYFGEHDTSFVPIVKVEDSDGDPLSVSYYIDSESIPRQIKKISNTATAQTISFDAMNVGSMQEGDHTFRFSVSDGKDVVQKSTVVHIDKTRPSIADVTFTTGINSLQISGSASDSKSGIHSYRFSVGSIMSPWTDKTNYTQTGLQPNTKYPFKFEARDRVGLTSAFEGYAVTKSEVPTISVGQITETSIEIILVDNNPTTTEYAIQVNQQYVSSSGALISSPTWVKLTSKKILVSNLPENKEFKIRVQARNLEGVPTAYSSEVSATTLPYPPTDIEFERHQRSILMRWKGIDGVSRYDVEVDGGTTNNGTLTTFTHSGLNPNTVHTYRVRAVNTGGVGSWSPLAQIYTLPDPPTIPTNIQAASSQTEIQIVWDIAERAEAYEIEVSGVIVDVFVASYIHKGLQPQTSYTYRVRAKNSGGKSEWSAPITKKTLPYPPQAPVNVKAELSIRNVTVHWPKVEGADSYEIEVDRLILDNGAATSYLHEGLEPLSGHTYRVRAVNEGGKSPWSEPLDITTHPEIPVAPTNVMTTSEETSISVLWYDVANAESYDVEINGKQIVNVKSNQYEHIGLSPNSKHSYRVRAKNISGEGPWSVVATMTTLPEGTGESFSLTNIVAIVTNTLITISWDTVAPDALYEVEVDGHIYDNGTNTIYHHTGLQPFEFHTYKIRLRDENGAVGDWVAILSLSTLPNPPDAPTALEAFPANHAIELKWEKVEGATGYELEIDGQTVDVGTARTYAHEPLEPGSSYTYRLRAKNETGVTAWSPAITQSTTTPTYKVNVANGKTFELSLLAFNVQDFSELTYVVTYDPSEVEIVDLYAFTPHLDKNAGGRIAGSLLDATYEPGRITYRSNQNVVPGTSWSGELATIVFKSKVTGEASIDVVVE